MKRYETRVLHVGNLQLGGQNKCLLQSMTNTKTKDVKATVKQINALQDAGCEIVRMAILDEEDALAIREIKSLTTIPLVADIHFNYNFALIAIEQGIDKIRINPGNIGSKENVRKVVEKCKEHHVPIRIGINSGSLEKEVLEKYGKPCAEAMIESAKKHVEILEELEFYDICLSFKSSNVPLTIDTYRLAAKTFPYPLHLGVTEAGSFNISAIKSSAALGALLHDGIGDTIRISVSSDPVNELFIGKQLLRAFNLIDKVPNLISCPTCGRIQYDMIPIVEEIEEFLMTIHSNIEVAIMGCPVNGPQEASRADIGVAGGKDGAILFKKGKIIKTVPQDQLVKTLKEEILNMVEEIK
ncbi:flavodoxin-dependent (E)-4-hydroxy-3-methylbut-2-enyl-diphosphate synthase [Anaerorhabdus furcosa]|uniref:4-hydroxy-3-methylbut-2-en-1-yl diphosphate synthase (flavodoxin) n=1 Tax=Anaerorhabdus furcosa TaxID=118967 RepID=A0A1T4P777_9FIRM|nr:flavodoxin-dependent (E)-4-hydroxy-3-methylbut-2-enyl-diphosphate synthase [Anaerorhabdus furcosa]SJZ87354.1 4-hydroxy-3-methylbut-2-en-1-yl diphosphate synthase [Anaerorhabdus furcosa]